MQLTVSGGKNKLLDFPSKKENTCCAQNKMWPIFISKAYESSMSCCVCQVQLNYRKENGKVFTFSKQEIASRKLAKGRQRECGN